MQHLLADCSGRLEQCCKVNDMVWILTICADQYLYDL